MIYGKISWLWREDMCYHDTRSVQSSRIWTLNCSRGIAEQNLYFRPDWYCIQAATVLTLSCPECPEKTGNVGDISITKTSLRKYFGRKVYQN